MKHAKPLPSFLQERYQEWHRMPFAKNKALYAKRVERGVLTLHGLWMGIRNGRLEMYNTETGACEQI